MWCAVVEKYYTVIVAGMMFIKHVVIRTHCNSHAQHIDIHCISFFCDISCMWLHVTLSPFSRSLLILAYAKHCLGDKEVNSQSVSLPVWL